MLDTSLACPPGARSVTRRRAVRLSDMDATGRVRLDAIARFLQDIAIEDVQETGWGAPEHLWFVRRIRVDVVSPFLRDREVEVTTWGMGMAAIAAGRRWSLRGDTGGRAEVDSVWIHLDAAQRPARIGEFGPYAAAASSRSVSTKLELPDPPTGTPRRPWPLRSADVDLHGHVNNAVHWQAVEDGLAGTGFDLAVPQRALLDYREPIDLGDPLELASWGESGGRRCLALLAGERVRAVAAVGPLGQA